MKKPFKRWFWSFLAASEVADREGGCPTLIHPTKAIKKLLSCAHRCFMDFCRAINQPEAFAKLPMEIFRVITNYI